jgi:predicted Zn-ribbon and HTH transcriptional regulator
MSVQKVNRYEEMRSCNSCGSDFKIKKNNKVRKKCNTCKNWGFKKPSLTLRGVVAHG